MILIVGRDNPMRSHIYPGLIGLAGAACLLAAGWLSHIQGRVVSPAHYRFLEQLCWIGLGAGICGAVWAWGVRKRSTRKAIPTLIISFCIGVVAMAVWTRLTMLPRYIGDEEPMTVSPSQGANKSMDPTAFSAAVSLRFDLRTHVSCSESGSKAVGHLLR